MENQNLTEFVDFQSVEKEYRDYVENGHPCIMAKTVFSMKKYHLNIYDDWSDDDTLRHLLDDLGSYIAQYDFNTNDFESFIAVFPNDNFANEVDFETKLWKTLQRLHDLDKSPWDQNVSRDPNNPNFSFSLKGRAFYIVGLHPKSSRIARQAPYTTIAFNLHWQFDRLREMGTYHRVRDRIRKNDEALQGSINPVLEDFGSDSETKQYSGRNVEKDWKCPFHPKPSRI